MSFIDFLANVGVFDILLPFILLFGLALWIAILKFYKNEDDTTKKVLKIIGSIIGAWIFAFIITVIRSFLRIISESLGWFSYVVVVILIVLIIKMKSKGK
jgi:uncharacterized membrane protein YbjE (DUF340 family)